MIQGVGLEYFADGKIKSSFGYVDDKANGECKEYFENGNIRCLANFKNGVQDGKTVFFYESGNVKSEDTFVAGHRVGECKVYYDTVGRDVKSIAMYDNQGKAEWRKVFFDNGDEVVVGDDYNSKMIAANYAFLTKNYDIEIVKDKEEQYVRKTGIGRGKGRSKRKRK